MILLLHQDAKDEVLYGRGEGTLSNTRRRSTGPKSEGWAEQYR